MAEEHLEFDLEAALRAERAVIASYSNPRVEKQEFQIPGSQWPITARRYQRTDLAQPKQLVIWFHGGAFVGGSLDMPEAEITSIELAERTSALVVSVDYKLCSDKVKFPAPQIDALDALTWALKEADRLGIPSQQLFIGGGSAGACLAGSLSLLARDRGVELGGVMPIYPVAHNVLPEFSEELERALIGVQHLTREFTERHNPTLFGPDLNDLVKWHCFPGDASDKSGQAAFLMIQAEADSLRASGDEWIRQLREVGVEVSEHLMLGADHGYLNRHPAKDRAMFETLNLMGEFLNSRV